MRPTPRKLALLMSLAGLGLSLGEAAHAKSDPTTHAGFVAAFGLSSLPDATDVDAAVRSDAETSAVPSGALDVILPAGDVANTPSEEDRAAIALAMVLMAEPFLPGPTLSMPVAPVSTAWEYSDAFLRDFQNGPSLGESSGEVAVLGTAVAQPPELISGSDASRGPGEADSGATAALAARGGEQARGLGVDLDLSQDGGVDLNLEIARGAGVDLNLELSAGLDVNLDLSPGLDLNLDLGLDLDLRLDRPPIFAVSKLRPTNVSMEPVAARARPEPTALSSKVDEPVRAPYPLPKIVVASHSDRVMRSLEALLATDGPATGRFGAQTEEVFVTSHAERALLMLASTCHRGDTENADIEFHQASPSAEMPQVPIAASVEKALLNAFESKPEAQPVQTARPARRSAMGDNVVAMSERSLDRVRGGFQTSNGLQISFGIERAVYINGALVTTTSLNLSDLGKVSNGQSQNPAASAAAGLGSLTLIQNGAGNTFVTGPVSATTLGTVVQNTLNDQKIQSFTSINATVNSLQLVKAQNFESSLRGALIDSLRR